MSQSVLGGVPVAPVVDPRSVELYATFEATLNNQGQLKGRQHVLQIAKAVFDHYFSQHPTQNNTQAVISTPKKKPQWPQIYNSKDCGVRVYFEKEYKAFMEAHPGNNYMNTISVLRHQLMANEPARWAEYINWVKAEKDKLGYNLDDPTPSKSPRNAQSVTVAPTIVQAAPASVTSAPVMPSTTPVLPGATHVMPSTTPMLPGATHVMPSTAPVMPSVPVMDGGEAKDLDLDVDVDDA